MEIVIFCITKYFLLDKSACTWSKRKNYALNFHILNTLQDIHTNAFIAQALNSGGIRAENLPPLITIIGFLMSFATGSVSLLH